MNDIEYCNGKRCALKESCRRYIEGLRQISRSLASKFPNNLSWRRDNCDEETRDMYLETIK